MKKKRNIATQCLVAISKFKGNIHHMKNCVWQLKQKEEKGENKKCRFCGKTFAQKSNRDCHVNSQHVGEVSDDTTTIPTFISDLESQSGPSNQQSDTASITDHLTPLYPFGSIKCVLYLMMKI